MLDLCQHLNPLDPWVPEAVAARPWAAMLGSEQIRLIVAEREGALAFSFLLVIVPNIMREARSLGVNENVVTHAAYRGQGLGRAVLATAVDAACRAGCCKGMLATGSRQRSAWSFCESAGFPRATRTDFEVRRDCNTPATKPSLDAPAKTKQSPDPRIIRMPGQARDSSVARAPHHPLPRCEGRPRRQGRELSFPARRRGPGGAGPRL
ncbi:MAG: GNAT family N-acetyltransferase [Roseococcus sp.]|nr:GNAT family N-acetyltransferase [Roseococcus sp.]